MDITRRDRVEPGFVFGLMLIAAGISSLLERAHLFESVSVGLWWPLVPMALGIARLRYGGIDRRSGWMLLAFGVWSLIVVLTPINFAETWPLLLLVWGASTMWKGPGAVGSVDRVDLAARVTSSQREQRHAN